MRKQILLLVLYALAVAAFVQYDRSQAGAPPPSVVPWDSVYVEFEEQELPGAWIFYIDKEKYMVEMLGMDPDEVRRALNLDRKLAAIEKKLKARKK